MTTKTGRSYEAVTADMMALARAKTTRQLAGALSIMRMKDEAGIKLNRHERHAHSVIVDVLCERHPEVDAAFQAWAESESLDLGAADDVIIAAARATLQ